MSAAGDFLKLPSFDEVLAALRLVDQFLRDLEAELKANLPSEAGPALDAALEKLQVAERMLGEVQKLAEAIAVLKTGRTPSTPDDVDL